MSAALSWAGAARAGIVLAIHSYHTDLAWTAQCMRALDNVLAGNHAVSHVFMDTKRIPESEFQARADAAMERFRELAPDLVILSDDNALRLLGPPLARTGTPVVYMGINNNPRSYFDAIPPQVTGVIERVPLFPWTRYLREIVPGPSNMLVLMDDSLTTRAIIDVTFGERKTITFGGRIVTYKVAADWDEWRWTVLHSRSYGLIVMPVFHSLEDGAGRHVPVEKVVRWTSANSPVPVFANQDYAVTDEGVVGAYVLRGESHARVAALMAKDILEGKNVRDLPVVNDQNGTFVFNKKQLARFGLTLPEEIGKLAVFQ